MPQSRDGKKFTAYLIFQLAKIPQLLREHKDCSFLQHYFQLAKNLLLKCYHFCIIISKDWFYDERKIYICVSSKWDVHKLRLDIFDILHSLYPKAIILKSALRNVYPGDPLPPFCKRNLLTVPYMEAIREMVLVNQLQKFLSQDQF